MIRFVCTCDVCDKEFEYDKRLKKVKITDGVSSQKFIVCHSCCTEKKSLFTWYWKKKKKIDELQELKIKLAKGKPIYAFRMNNEGSPTNVVGWFEPHYVRNSLGKKIGEGIILKGEEDVRSIEGQDKK